MGLNELRTRIAAAAIDMSFDRSPRDQRLEQTFAGIAINRNMEKVPDNAGATHPASRTAAIRYIADVAVDAHQGPVWTKCER